MACAVALFVLEADDEILLEAKCLDKILVDGNRGVNGNDSFDE
jgi:hypothetical protein